MSGPNGGPAYPADVYYDERRIGQHTGMSLRDACAIAALPVIVSEQMRRGVDPGERSTLLAAQWAYAYADAMVKARQK